MSWREWIADNIGYRFFGCAYNATTQPLFDYFATVVPKQFFGSDVPIESKSKQYKANMKRMKALVKQRKGEALLDNVSYLPLTPKRYLSLYDPGGIEDVFDYYRKQPKLTVFSRIKQPLCVVLAGGDEYTDRPVQDILTVFDRYQKSTNYHSAIIPDSYHSFGGKEVELSNVIFSWFKKIQ